MNMHFTCLKFSHKRYSLHHHKIHMTEQLEIMMRTYRFRQSCLPVKYMYLISRNEVSVQIDKVCLGHNSVRMKMASVKYTMKHVSYDSTGNVHEVHMQINKNSQVVKRTECISKRKMFKKYH